jgi:hypothetical protein
MALWLEPGGTEDYTLEGVTFKIRKLTARQQIEVAGHAQAMSADMTPDMVDRLFSIIRMGLVGWTGDGAPECVLEGDVIADESLDRMALTTLTRLSTAILDINSMSDTDRGNSLSSSQPDSGEQGKPDA